MVLFKVFMLEESVAKANIIKSATQCESLTIIACYASRIMGPMVDSFAWQFFNLRIEVSHQEFDIQLRDFINSVLVIIINVGIISFHSWSMYLNYGDLEMSFLKMCCSYMFIDRFQANQSFWSKCTQANAYFQDMMFYMYKIFY